MTLSAPLNDATALYRPQAANPLPSEGSDGSPLTLTGAAVVHDTTLGDYIHYPTGNDYSSAPIPPALLNGDVTFAIRYRPDGSWIDRCLMSIVDPGTLKHFMLTVASGNNYLARFWDNSQSHAQITTGYSTTHASTSRTDDIVVTWEATTKTIRLYINGVLECSGISGNPRSTIGSAALSLPASIAGGLPIAGKVFGIAHWHRCLSAAEVAALTANPDWTGQGPPPPPPPGLVVKFNGTVEPDWVVKLNGVVVGGTGDTIDVTGSP